MFPEQSLTKGECIECHFPRRLNRLKLCYECWVERSLKEQGWIKGTPHPDWCECVECSIQKNLRRWAN